MIEPPQTNLRATAEQPRGARLFIVAALLALVGLIDALYLTLEHLAGRAVQCTLVHGCGEVLGSSYATVGGVPLAAFGAAAYFAVFSLATLAAFGYRACGKLMLLIVPIMFLFTLWLLYLQAFVIGKFCQFCLLSAVTTTLLFIISLIIYFRRRRFA